MDEKYFIKINDSGLLHKSSKIFSNVSIGHNTIIEEFCLIGKPHRETRKKFLLNKNEDEQIKKTQIGNNCFIQAGTIIYEGVVIEDDVICGDYVTIGSGSKIHAGTKIHYRANIFKDVLIGFNCRIGGFCCNNSIVGNGSSVYGKLVHHYTRHGGNNHDQSPKIGSNVIVGFDSVIVGGIIISDNSYVASGAIVTKDVPEKSIVIGTNQIYSIEEWSGRLKGIKNV